MYTPVHTHTCSAGVYPGCSNCLHNKTFPLQNWNNHSFISGLCLPLRILISMLSGSSAESLIKKRVHQGRTWDRAPGTLLKASFRLLIQPSRHDPSKRTIIWLLGQHIRILRGKAVNSFIETKINYGYRTVSIYQPKASLQGNKESCVWIFLSSQCWFLVITHGVPQIYMPFVQTFLFFN